MSDIHRIKKACLARTLPYPRQWIHLQRILDLHKKIYVLDSSNWTTPFPNSQFPSNLCHLLSLSNWLDLRHPHSLLVHSSSFGQASHFQRVSVTLANTCTDHGRDSPWEVNSDSVVTIPYGNFSTPPDFEVQSTWLGVKKNAVVHEALKTSFLLHSHSSYHCSTHILSPDIHDIFWSDCLPSLTW